MKTKPVILRRGRLRAAISWQDGIYRIAVRGHECVRRTYAGAMHYAAQQLTGKRVPR